MYLIKKKSLNCSFSFVNILLLSKLFDTENMKKTYLYLFSHLQERMWANFTTYAILMPQVTYDLLDTWKFQELKDDAVNGSEKKGSIIIRKYMVGGKRKGSRCQLVIGNINTKLRQKFKYQMF